MAKNWGFYRYLCRWNLFNWLKLSSYLFIYFCLAMSSILSAPLWHREFLFCLHLHWMLLTYCTMYRWWPISLSILFMCRCRHRCHCPYCSHWLLFLYSQLNQWINFDFCRFCVYFFSYGNFSFYRCTMCTTHTHTMSMKSKRQINQSASSTY